MTTIFGPFGASDPPAFRTFSIPVNFTKVLLNFIFHEIDGWDGDHIRFGTDTLSLNINGDLEDSVNFGWFRQNFSEPSQSGTSELGSISWNIDSAPEEASPQGYSSLVVDQQHFVSVDIPLEYFNVSRELLVEIIWDLNEEDEMVGIDDFRVAGCQASGSTR